ncbi:MAG: hypothetical protein HDR98_06800 [Bacteroides sp.]|nr:hypothetical protein [Bacteroides sp.]
MNGAENINTRLKTIVNYLYYNGYVRFLWLLRFLSNPKEWINHESYYPELKSKSKGKIYLEQLGQILRYGTPNMFYSSYGFDVKSRDEMQEYYHYSPFSVLRDRYNSTVSPIESSLPILRNKFYFGMFCEYFGIKSGETVGILYGDNNGSVYLSEKKTNITLDEFCRQNNGKFFVKPLNGECGKGIFSMVLNNGGIFIDNEKVSLSSIKDRCKGETYLIQSMIRQHPQMSNLHPQSLNTIRLVTVKNIHTGDIAVLPSILRIGTGDAIVDNTSQGGVAVGIDFENNHLKQYGFMKPQFGGRVDIHPDSKIRFEEFTIPYLEQAVAQAKFLHSHLPDLHSIGWDIAIGEDGPIFIEGNDNWEINGPQICNGGLKKLYKELLVGKN